MTNEIVKELVERIRQELDEFPHVLARVKEGWERARRSNDDFYIDAVALNLHGLYLGAERIFTYIVEIVDDDPPRGENWHLRLLQQMMRENPGIRPPVISIETGTKLDEYRRFRHVVRNLYTRNLDPAKVGTLVSSAQDLFDQLHEEIMAFVAFLDQE